MEGLSMAVGPLLWTVALRLSPSARSSRIPLRVSARMRLGDGDWDELPAPLTLNPSYTCGLRCSR